MAETAGKPCVGFFLVNPLAAYEHMTRSINRLADYGSFQYGHSLHTWDDGERFLAKCGRCGGYILIQSSEFHSFTDSDDSFFTDFFPVSSPEEAEELNRRYDGFQIERDFGKRFLMETNGRVRRSK